MRGSHDGEVDLSLGTLFSGTVHVRRAALEGLAVSLVPGTNPPDPVRNGNPLDPPIGLRIEDFSLRDARVVSDGAEVVHVRDAALAATWTSASLSVQRLDVQADQGEVHFTGTVAGGASEPRVFGGDGNGRFRWQVGAARVRRYGRGARCRRAAPISRCGCASRWRVN